MHNLFLSFSGGVIKRKEPWIIYLLLLMVFIFAQPFDLYYSLHYLDRSIRVAYLTVEKIEGGSVARIIALLLLGGYAAISLLLSRGKKIQCNSPLGYLILFFLTLATLSILWSQEISLTARKIGVLWMLCLGALAIGRRFPMIYIINFSYMCGIFTLLLGLICEISLGTFRPLEPRYRFGGEIDPVYQAMNCGMIIISGLILYLHRKRRRFYYLFSAIISVPFMLLTKSRAPSAITYIAVFTIIFIVANQSKRIKYIYFIIMIFLIMYSFLGNSFFVYPKEALLLGRERTSINTITGRVPLWAECFDYLAQRPFIGFGYDSFWTPDRYFSISRETKILSPDTHNTFINLMLGVGLLGAASTLLIFIITIKQIILMLRSFRSAGNTFAFVFVLYFLLNNLLLATYLNPSIPSFIFMLILAKLAFFRKGSFL